MIGLIPLLASVAAINAKSWQLTMSECTTGHRNRAMAHLMLNFGMIDQKIDEALDLYFQQCSIINTEMSTKIS